jgi:hypothetical protein
LTERGRAASASATTASSAVAIPPASRVVGTRSPEEIAFEMGFINVAQLRELALPLVKSGYGMGLLEQAKRAL